MSNHQADKDVQLRMQEVRDELGRNVAHAVHGARQLLDWRRCVAAHPWACMTAAAAAGFLLVPKRAKSPQPTRNIMAELAERSYATDGPRRQASIAGRIAATLLDVAARAAARQATTHVSQFLDRRRRSAVDQPQADGSCCSSGDGRVSS